MARCATPLCAAVSAIKRSTSGSGRGFYLYEGGSRAPRPDPEVERLIVDVAAQGGVARRIIGADEIIERALYPMINEGARILAEGIARRAGDIDVIWVHGYGFPVHRGGPMHYADSLGLANICGRLTAFAEQTGDDRHRPAPLLAKLAAERKGFASLGA